MVMAPNNSQNFRCWRLVDTSGINSANNVGVTVFLYRFLLHDHGVHVERHQRGKEKSKYKKSGCANRNISLYLYGIFLNNVFLNKISTSNRENTSKAQFLYSSCFLLLYADLGLLHLVDLGNRSPSGWRCP